MTSSTIRTDSSKQEVLARTAKLQRFRTAMDATGDAIFLGRRRDRTRSSRSTRRRRGCSGTAGRSSSGWASVSLEATTQIELERLRDAIVGGSDDRDARRRQRYGARTAGTSPLRSIATAQIAGDDADHRRAWSETSPSARRPICASTRWRTTTHSPDCRTGRCSTRPWPRRSRRPRRTTGAWPSSTSTWTISRP